MQNQQRTRICTVFKVLTMDLFLVYIQCNLLLRHPYNPDTCVNRQYFVLQFLVISIQINHVSHDSVSTRFTLV